MAGCLLSWAAPNKAAAVQEGYQLDVPAIGLRFNTPTGWVLSKDSKPEELLLFGDHKKRTPLLRIRSFAGRLSAEDRLPAMKRSLPEGEAQVSFVSSEKWDRGGRLYETARAVYTSGTREWQALFTLVDQPKKLQHGFWLYGKKKDLDKHWAAIQSSIASAKSIPGKGQARPGARRSAADKPKSSEPVWKDAKLGLRLSSWPAGFALDRATEKALGKDGVLLRPLDKNAARATLFRLTARTGQAPEAAAEAVSTLKTALEANSAVEAIRQVPLRVGGEPAFMLRWTDRSGKDEAFLHEAYLVQKQATLFQIDYAAPDLWARARSRRSLVKDFVAGVTLR